MAATNTVIDEWRLVENEQVSSTGCVALYLCVSAPAKSLLAPLQLQFPQSTLTLVYIKELKSPEAALRYILEDFGDSAAVPGLVVLYTELSEQWWEAVAALQHTVRRKGLNAVCGSPDSTDGIRLAAQRYFTKIIE